jgi:hypothetical protein
MSNDNKTDGGLYERSVTLDDKVKNMTISDGKVYDQKEHDMRKVPQWNREPILRDPSKTTEVPYSFSDYDVLRPKYRGVGPTVPSLPGTIGGAQSLQTMNPKSGGSGSTVEREEKKLVISPPIPPTASSTTPVSTAFNTSVDVTTKESSKVDKVRSRQPLSVPNEPIHISKSTSFSTQHTPSDILAMIQAKLEQLEGVSYEFFIEKFRWEGVYLVCSMRCKFEINVYRRASGGYVIEGNRLCGESIAFVGVYRSVYNLFNEKKVEKSTWTCFGPSPPTKRKALDSDVVASLKAVIAMAESSVGEAKVNAAQIFSNMASDSSKHRYLVENDCVPLLIQLMKFEFQSCDQFAAIALTQLSEYPPCRQLLAQNKEFLEILLPLCSADGNYNSTEMRRKCTQLLANISGADRGAQHVVTAVGRRHVDTFLQNVDSLKDLQQRELANVAKRSLAACT